MIFMLVDAIVKLGVVDIRTYVDVLAEKVVHTAHLIVTVVNHT